MKGSDHSFEDTVRDELTATLKKKLGCKALLVNSVCVFSGCFFLAPLCLLAAQISISTDVSDPDPGPPISVLLCPRHKAGQLRSSLLLWSWETLEGCFEDNA